MDQLAVQSNPKESSSEPWHLDTLTGAIDTGGKGGRDRLEVLRPTSLREAVIRARQDVLLN